MRISTDPNLSHRNALIAIAALLAPQYASSQIVEESGSFSAEETQAVLPTVTVSAQRREENLQETPVAVTALSSTELANRGIDNVAQLQDLAPNLSISSTAAFSGSSSTAVVFVRGIGQTDFALTTEPGVGVYIDEVYSGRSLGALLDLGDVARVEVLRGPQGTLFGKNTIGGALVVTSERPSFDEYSGEAELTVGSFERVDARALVNLPLGDTAALRVALGSQNYDGYAERIVAGDRLGGKDTLAAKASFLYQPNADFELLLRGDITSSEGDSAPTSLIGLADGTFIVPGETTPRPLGAVAGLEFGLGLAPGTLTFENFNTGDPFRTNGVGSNFSEDDTWGVSATAEYGLTENVSIKSITAYRSVEAMFGRDPFNLPFNPTVGTTDEYEQDQFTQEIQLSGRTQDDRLSWLFGGFYLHETGANRNFVEFNDILLGFGAGPVSTLNSGGEIDNTSVAIFGQLNYDLNDRLGVFAGLRYSEEEKSFDTRGYQFLVELPFLLLAPQAELTESYDNWAPKLGFDYKLTENSLLYGSYSEGFKGGGFVQRVFPGLIANPNFELSPYGPETASVYEVGLKSDLFNNRLRLNLAAFYSDYSDVQITVLETPSSFTPATVNGGEVEITGFEAEFDALPTNWLRLSGMVGYLDASFVDVDPRATDITLQSKLPYTSEWTSSLSAVADVYSSDSFDISIRADYAYRDEFFTEAQNDLVTLQPAYETLNLSALIQVGDDLRIQAGVTNATDEEYLMGANSVLNSIGYAEGNFAPPKEFFLTVKKQF